MRHTHTQYQNGSSDTAYTSAYILGLPKEITVDQGAAVASDTKYGYDTYDGQNSVSTACAQTGGYSAPATSARGNRTSVSEWLNTNSTWLTSYFSFDQLGNETSALDANGHRISYGYNDDGSGECALPTSLTNALSQVTQFRYDYGIEKVTSVTDPNGIMTTYAYADPLDRPTQQRAAAGTSAESDTVLTYNVGTTDVNIYTDQNVTGAAINTPSTALREEQLFDGFGRQIERRSYIDPGHYTSVTNSFNALGQLAETTNPVQLSIGSVGAGPATTFQYDFLARVIKTVQPDGTAVSTAYSGNETTVTDEAGVQRSTFADALSRLTSVIEYASSTNYQTTYAYL